MRCGCWVANAHAESRGKGADLDALRVDVLREVLDCHAAVGLLGEEPAELVDTLVGAVARLEEHGGCPVVGEVLGHGAGGACGEGGGVGGGVHGCVEGVPAHDLVQMGGA